ncbi:MAG: RagB/SusD family nutrient uptake outer membrane protein [Mangrovibacterium sp.]
MNNIFLNALSGFTILLVGTSCSGFLDEMPTSYSSTGFYQSEAAIETGVSGIYNSLYIESSSVPFYIHFDDYTPFGLQRSENTTIGAGGGLTVNNGIGQTWWSGNYVTIARANSLIHGSAPYLESLGGKTRQYIAEARLLRAFAWYNLISVFGDVPFFTEPVMVDQYNVERTSKVVILDFILEEMDEIAEDLPWTATDRGRVDRATAMGLKARAALLGGSLDYGGKGTEYFRIAAAVAQSVFGNRSLAVNYDDLFTKTGQKKSDVRSETLFELMYSDQGSTKYHVTAFGQVSRNYGQTGRHPAQLLADTYECIDGKRIDESPLYDPKKPSKNRDPRFRSTIWMHGDTVEGNTNGTDAGRIRFVLEVYNPTTRFYNFNTNTWYTGTNADIQSSAAWASFANAGVGYIWRKFSYETQEAINKNTVNIPIMRYAELLLTYAEAKIELGELDESVYDAINQVRNRSDMPDVSADRIGNQNKMRQLIRRERKVELIHEGLHFIDMRRWKTGDIENDSPSYGYPVALTKDANGYITSGGYDDVTPDMVPNFKKTERHDLNDIANYDAYKDKLKVRDRNRFWDDKFYLFPIPLTETDRNPNLKQNEGH